VKKEDGDLILILTRRIALQQKIDSSHIRWSEMERTYRKDKKKKRRERGETLGFMKSYATRSTCGTNHAPVPWSDHPASRGKN
jgi:hypothetical protein